jgi:two-component system, NtrC family, sensor kinase
MYDLSRFALSDMIKCSTALRSIGGGADSMEEVADRIVRYLFDHLVRASTGERSCALVRCFKTHAVDALPPDLQRTLRPALDEPGVQRPVPCLTLLATAGTQPEWNARRDSTGHQAIPLLNEQMIAQTPMIARLLQEFGLSPATLLAPDESLLVDPAHQTYNVFYVPEALGSPWVPAQAEFVAPYGIRSVLGFGGMLPPGDLFAVIMFTTQPIPQETADLFRTISLSVKSALLPFVGGQVFSDAEEAALR